MARTRNPEQTRRAILDAGRREFAAVGFAGARTDTIAAAAKVNKRMLYHYFGSKERLYAAVLTDRLGAQRTLPYADSLVAYAERRLADLHVEPDDLRLLMWEALAAAAPDAVAQATRDKTWRGRVATLAALQRDGRVAADIDAAQLELALTALTVFPIAFRQVARLITGGAPGDPAFDAAQRAFLGSLLVRLESGVVQPRAIKSAGPRATDDTSPSATQPSDRKPSGTEPGVAKPRVRLTAATISRAG
jgi:TetR/AcrR family transcriptional regulator